jgi:hypothetical protein
MDWDEFAKSVGPELAYVGQMLDSMWEHIINTYGVDPYAED